MHQWQFDVDKINYACCGYENKTKTRLIDDLMVGFNDMLFSMYILYIFRWQLDGTQRIDSLMASETIRYFSVYPIEYYRDVALICQKSVCNHGE